ncbi:MAG: sugar phosphate isomerase/epimerase [Oscillospiraceae bacterium]|nr:sugar phosphate isomerase/epimerase [Oscillospiraceae bacterium]
MNFPISVWLPYFNTMSVREAISSLVKAGFFHGELSTEHYWELLNSCGDPIAAGKTLKEYADSVGYKVLQGHLTFNGGLCDDSAMERLKPEMDMFMAAGIRSAVLHVNGGNELSPEERYNRWICYLGKLADYVDGSGMTLCIENVHTLPYCYDAAKIKTLINDAGGKNLGICLDTGHLHLTRTAGHTEESFRDFILGAGDLLQALHITDNNGTEDSHQMPFSARRGVPWQEVMQALKDIDYKGLFNLEIIGERYAPLAIKLQKLAFVRSMCDYMMSEEFLAIPPEAYLPPMERR